MTSHGSSSSVRRADNDRVVISRRIKIRISILVLSFAVVGSVAAGILAHQVISVRSQLLGVVTNVSLLQSHLEAGDFEEAEKTLISMEQDTSVARSTATGPLWMAGSSVPLIGQNLETITEIAVSADDLITGAVEPLLTTYGSFDWQALTPANGSINVGQLEEAAPAIKAATDTVEYTYKRLDAINHSNLLPQVSAPLRSATEQLSVASKSLRAASSAAQLLPAMLGVDGPRTYLVLIQNSAESRATGGIPGALAIVNVDDGNLTLTEQSSATAMGAFKPSIAVDPAQTSLFTARLGTQMQNVNLTPDFPTAATTAKQMWEMRHPGQIVDGVFALDPVVLSHLLASTGPVELTDPQILVLIKDTLLPSSLTTENVVSTLLSDVYREIEDPSAQDGYFAAVAGSVFAAFADGKADSTLLLKALTSSAQEQRVKAWSSIPAEQNVLEGTVLGGSVVGTNVGGATFGAYFNDGTGAKMDYYVARTVQLLQSCEADNYNGYTVRTTVTNNAPLDAAARLPSYVTGGGVFGVEPGRIRTNYVVYGPAQSLVETATVNGQSVPIGTGKHGQRPVGTVTIELGPGESVVLDVTFSRVVQDSEPRLMVTPSIVAPEEVILPTFRENSCE